VRAFWEDAAVDHGTSRDQGLRYAATRALETFALRRASHVTTICEGLRKDIVARGIAERKVTVIPNAVDVDAFEFGVTPDLALKSELGVADCIIVGFVGSFYAYEGLDLLLAALPMALQRVPTLRVLFVGGGPDEAALRAQARSLGIEEKVIFTGRVPHREVHRYYSIVDVFAFPRHSMRLTELVTPLKPLEAMAQGRLLVASDVGGHRELIEDGVTGVLFRADDAGSLAGAIVRLLSEPERWPRLLRQARTFVERERTWAASVARYRPIFDALAPAPR
jgi:PEP-CTERM/exosortase A-associated glycosyltransferase